MAFDLDHWNNPRGSIANKHVNNDFAYVSRGANIATYVMNAFDIKPSEAKNMTVIDYGCGTGRGAAFLSLVFGKVIGYDPNHNCIRVAHEENQKSDIKFPNLILTTNINEVPNADIAFSTNVIEHLNDHDAAVMVNNIKVRVAGKTLLWYAPTRNSVLQPYIVGSNWEERKKLGGIQVDFFDIH